MCVAISEQPGVPHMPVSDGTQGGREEGSVCSHLSSQGHPTCLCLMEH